MYKSVRTGLRNLRGKRHADRRALVNQAERLLIDEAQEVEASQERERCYYVHSAGKHLTERLSRRERKEGQR